MQRMPRNIILELVDIHLYRIELRIESGKGIKRNKFPNPLLISLINITVIIKSINSLLSPDENIKLFIMNGDFAYFLGIKYHYNIACILLFLLALISQPINYYKLEDKV